MAASVLSRKFKSSKYATEEEKNRFQSEGENYIKDLWKKINSLEIFSKLEFVFDVAEDWILRASLFEVLDALNELNDASF